MFRVLVTGSRTWKDVDAISSEFDIVASHEDEVTLVVGNAGGADSLAVLQAIARGWVIEEHVADWVTYPRSAGYARDKEMVLEGADYCLAFIHNKSKGATTCSKNARAEGIPTKVIEQSTPEWVLEQVQA